MSQGVFRDYMQTVTDQDLLDLWNEIVDWELEMAIPMDAKLREATRQAFAVRGVDMHEDVGEQSLMILNCGHEVWREVALRAMQGDWFANTKTADA